MVIELKSGMKMKCLCSRLLSLLFMCHQISMAQSQTANNSSGVNITGHRSFTIGGSVDNRTEHMLAEMGGLLNDNDTSVPLFLSEGPKSLQTVGNLTTEDLFFPVKITYQLNVSNSNRYLAQDVTDFACRSRRFCNDSMSNYRGVNVCAFDCMPCQCDEHCHFYGDCCPDAAFQDSPDISSASFPYLICTTDEWTTWLNSTNIFMVGKCPPNSDPVLVQKCEFPDITIQREATPLNDVKSNIAYRNSFCAECHGIIDFEIWRHEVTCSLSSSIQFASSKADLWRIVVEDTSFCSIVTKPPSLTSLRDCYPVTHSTCNGTGNAEVNQEPTVEILCGMYSHPVHYYAYSSNIYDSYRNLFCAMCDGIVLESAHFCGRIKGNSIPFPLNVLLDFNPPSERAVEAVNCNTGQAVDPFSNTCMNISCPARRYLVNNHCEEIFSSASGLGMAFDAVLRPADTTILATTEGFLDQYASMLNESLYSFSPIAVSFISARFFTADPFNVLLGPAEVIQISADVISQTTRNLTELEIALLSIMKENFTYQTNDNNSIYFRSTPILCPWENNLAEQYEEIVILRNMRWTSLNVLDPSCEWVDCISKIYFVPVQLNCPFLVYDLNNSIFTYFPDNHTVLFSDHVLNLARNAHLKCEGFLQICTDELVNVGKFLNLGNTSDQNLALSIVSLVCISLSLAGLILTFITYSLIPKLRTLPGMNTMALVLNLFLAQLLFLTTSNRTSNIILCQIFGVLIHYFWLSVFAWMSISAYHMFLVFTCLSANIEHRDDRMRFLRYTTISNLSPSVVVAVCLGVSFARSDGMDSGYGGRVCFVNNPIAIGGFFAAPLGLMLILNTFFFVRTIHAIKSVPDMKTSKNQNNHHHIVVYIKLSLLFGFTWTFGILAEIIQSDELNYAFVVLSGSQGLLLFLAYCVNKRIYSQLGGSFGFRSSTYQTSTLSPPVAAISSNTTETVVVTH